jgi:hypothetical protein
MKPELYNKEYTTGKILLESWRILKENFRLILLITLVVYVPVGAILAFIPVDKLMEQHGFAYALRIHVILESLIGIIASMAIAYVVKSRLDGQAISFRQALKKSLSRWTAALWTNSIMVIFLLGLTVLLIILGIMYYVYWIFVLYVVALQDKSGKDALNYSKVIVKGRWWKVATYYFIFGLWQLVVYLITYVPLIIFLPENFFINVATDLVFAIVTSCFMVVYVIFFINFDSTKKEVVAIS